MPMKIYSDEEARQRKNMRQKEYAKRTNHMAARKYDKENIKKINVIVNVKTESDIIEKLESVENKSGYIKKLIREDIERNK